MNKYSNEQIGWLRNNAIGVSWNIVTERFNQRFNMNCSIANVTYLARYNGIKNGIANGIIPKFNNGYLSSGYLYIKANGKNIYKARFEYEKHNGKIPKGYIIIFKDGNKFNFDKDNLVAVSRKDSRLINGESGCLKGIKKTIDNYESRLLIGKIQSKTYRLVKKKSSVD